MTMEEIRERYVAFYEEHQDMEESELNRAFCNEVATGLEEWFYLMSILEN